jgi:hypothetical protein
LALVLRLAALGQAFGSFKEPLGSASDSQVRELAAQQLTAKLADQTTAVYGCQRPAMSGYS